MQFLKSIHDSYIENCYNGSKCVNYSYLAAVGIVCNEGCQELDGILHRIYGFIHESSHSELHHLAVPAQRKGLTHREFTC